MNSITLTPKRQARARIGKLRSRPFRLRVLENELGMARVLTRVHRVASKKLRTEHRAPSTEPYPELPCSFCGQPAPDVFLRDGVCPDCHSLSQPCEPATW
jgi:hypothetical protein